MSKFQKLYSIKGNQIEGNFKDLLNRIKEISELKIGLNEGTFEEIIPFTNIAYTEDFVCGFVPYHKSSYSFIKEIEDNCSNYWLNSIILRDKQQRDMFLDETNSKNVMTRPIWTMMNNLVMFKSSQCGDLSNSEWLQDRVVNLPSSSHY
mgnify:CR=1 FL=1